MAGTFSRGTVANIIALALAVASTSVPAAETVQSLRYGVSLYHLYQGEYFESLTELMVGQTRAELGSHSDNAELLRGGIALSYGMDREAERVFEAMLSEPREGVDRERAWFYLARLAWQRGELERARSALAHTDKLASKELAQEARYLKAAIALRQGKPEEAITAAGSLDEESGWRDYFDYNMGAAHAAAGHWLRASESFRSVTALAPDPELHSLRDRALTASGYALMAAGRPADASVDFLKVRLGSEESDRALLGYGWAAMERGDYLAALSPWQTLSQQPPVSQSVRESLLAIPYAYEQLERPGLALGKYREASATLETELVQVREAIDLFAGGNLESLLTLDAAGSEEWLFGSDILPLSEQAPYIQHLIASHPFQDAMKELRDLQRIDQRLGQSRQKLRVLAEADSEQQTSWSRVIGGGGRDRLAQRLAQLRTRLARTSSQLEQAELSGDGRALADRTRQAQWQRLERAEQAAAKLGVEAEKGEMLRIYRGLLTWEDSETFPDRRWRARREVEELRRLLAESETGMARLDQSLARRRHSSFAPRIAALDTRLTQQQRQVQLALGQSESQLRQVAVTELERQARALQHALGQSRLAVARLYDVSSTGTTP